MKFFSKVLIIFGILLLSTGAYLVYQRYSTKTLEFKNVELVDIKKSEIKPIRITIPSVRIDNGIYEAKITNKNWETTDKGISYLLTSPVPGEKGNSVLYGHNWTSILGNLTKVKPGQQIKIYLNNGDIKIFIIKFTSIVSSDENQILSQTNDKRLTIYTCTGFLDSKRFVAVAILKE